MKKEASAAIIFLFALFCLNIYSGYCQVQVTPAIPAKGEIKTFDVNKDGNPDVTYYTDGKYVTKAEADTNYDGKPDVVVYTKDGKFESAEVDTNYDGKTEKKFSDVKAFNEWLNENSPDFNDHLNRPDWDIALLKF
ncbi:MAG: hypothetical protein PHQ57_00710 [Candidatus Omnitrophica bacterium]|nr:hypothetical protein [Candidatus Omnitrophota bacterium]